MTSAESARGAAALALALAAVAATAAPARAQSDSIFAETAAEERPVAVPNSCRTPQFPVQMRVARIEGRVLLAFVVDTAGRVEPTSVTALQSTHALFESAARRAVLSCRYRPGRFDGSPVRVRIQMPFNFRIAASP